MIRMLVPFFLIGCATAPETRGDACFDYASATCSGLLTCGALGSRDQVARCENEVVAECCGDVEGDNLCDELVLVSLDVGDWQQCLRELKQDACLIDEDYVAPAICQLL